MADWMQREYDQETVEAFGPAFPYAYWVNGDRKLKAAGGVVYTGGWFMPADQVDSGLLSKDGVPGVGWVKGTQDFQNGESKDGYFAQNISIAMLAFRRRWIVNGQKSSYAWTEYHKASTIGKPRGHIQVLGVVHGMEAAGPLFLSAKGMVGKHILGDENSVFNAFMSNVITEAARYRGGKGKPPFRAFWLTIGPEMDGKDPKYTTVGTGNETSVITMPALVGIAGKLSKEDLVKRYVGDALMDRLEELVKSAEVTAWKAAWDNTVLEEPAGDEPPYPAEEDMPF